MMQDSNSILRFKYSSINQQSIDKPFFIPNNLLSPDKKPSSKNLDIHYEITFAANKNNFGPFCRETFIDVTKHIYCEVDSYVHDTTKLKMVKYINDELKIKVSSFKEFTKNILPKLVIRNPELAWMSMYGWAELTNKAESEVMSEEIMKDIGLAYINQTTGRNKGCINSLCKSRTRDVYRNMNQTLKYELGVTLNRTGLKAKQKRSPGKYYDEFLHVLDELRFKTALQLECATLQLCQEGSIEKLKARIQMSLERNKRISVPEESNEDNSEASSLIIVTEAKNDNNREKFLKNSRLNKIKKNVRHTKRYKPSSKKQISNQNLSEDEKEVEDVPLMQKKQNALCK